MKRATKKNAARNGRPVVRRRKSGEEGLEELKKKIAAKWPLMGEIFKISASVPRDDWEKLPKDLSYNLDHYLYGMPKRRR